MRRVIVLCLLSILIFSCSESEKVTKAEEDDNNDTGEIINNDLGNQPTEIIYEPYEELAKSADARINEASGITASLYVPETYWA